MQWTDEGIIVDFRSFGESSLILTLFTPNQGLVKGLVRKAKGKKGNVYEVGAKVSATWKARLKEHLGGFQIEVLKNPAASFFHDYQRLSALQAACGLMSATFPEDVAHKKSYDDLENLIAYIPRAEWQEAYIRWEVSLLSELGFGFDLSCCAVTGQPEGLTHISPKTGRAVCEAAAKPYLDKLLILPAFLVDGTSPNQQDIHHGLKLTGYFLERHVFLSHNKPVPKARQRFLDSLKRLSA